MRSSIALPSLVQRVLVSTAVAPHLLALGAYSPSPVQQVVPALHWVALLQLGEPYLLGTHSSVALQVLMVVHGSQARFSSA